MELKADWLCLEYVCLHSRFPPFPAFVRVIFVAISSFPRLFPRINSPGSRPRLHGRPATGGSWRPPLHTPHAGPRPSLKIPSRTGRNTILLLSLEGEAPSSLQLEKRLRISASFPSVVSILDYTIYPIGTPRTHCQHEQKTYFLFVYPTQKLTVLTSFLCLLQCLIRRHDRGLDPWKSPIMTIYSKNAESLGY